MAVFGTGHFLEGGLALFSFFFFNRGLTLLSISMAIFGTGLFFEGRGFGFSIVYLSTKVIHF